ncbi:hypothetical protein Pelo_2326 [Pelomyxa schiedti]|nr:hypothetical protein Pelo_2326 [Pelomyxa schiedti]
MYVEPRRRRLEETERIVRVSRVVWEHVVEPMVVVPYHNRGAPVAPSLCCWLLGLADALFPLVPRACSLLMGGVDVLELHDMDFGRTHTSRYFALKCAAAAASIRCINWIMKSKQARNLRKECLAVLRGLCLGGHLGMAKELVSQSFDNSWNYRTLLRWPGKDTDMIDDIREIRAGPQVPHSLLYDACKGGHLDVVKWVTSTFDGVGTELWELPMPFRAAVRGGHIDVVKWLASNTRVVSACRQITEWDFDRCSLSTFIASPSLDVVKFCTELFWADVRGGTAELLMAEFIEYCSSGELEEGCQWIKERYSMTSPPNLNCTLGTRGFKWVTNSFSVQPTQLNLHFACTENPDAEFIEWITTNFPNSARIVPPSTFIWACQNQKDSVPVLEVLLTKTSSPLKEDDILECLVDAVSNNNTSVAAWLEKKFHVMDRINATPSLTDKTFTKICSNSESRGTSGIQWFLSNCTVTNIGKNAVCTAILGKLGRSQAAFALLLMDTFSITEWKWIGTASSILFPHELSKVMQIVAHVSFSPKQITQGFPHYVHSGKVVRWFIQNYHLNEQQVKMNNNKLLSALIANNKKSCAEWIIRTFHVTLKELSVMDHNHETETTFVRVGTWKMLMRVFPEMTASFVHSNLWLFAVASPLHIMASQRILGIGRVDVNAKELWSGSWNIIE